MGWAGPGSHFWGFERRGLDPDIVTLGKPVANGYPMGVVIANRDLIEAFQADSASFRPSAATPWRPPAGLRCSTCSSARSCMANAASTGRLFRQQTGGARGTASRPRRACAGTGLLLGLEVNESGGLPARQCAKRIINMLASEARVLIGYEGPDADMLKLRPPMLFRPEHAERLLQAIEAAAATLASESG